MKYRRKSRLAWALCLAPTKLDRNEAPFGWHCCERTTAFHKTRRMPICSHAPMISTHMGKKTLPWQMHGLASGSSVIELCQSGNCEFVCDLSSYHSRHPERQIQPDIYHLKFTCTKLMQCIFTIHYKRQNLSEEYLIRSWGCDEVI